MSSIQAYKITYKEFMLLPDDEFIEQKVIGKNMRPVSNGIPDIIEWSYDKVKTLQSMFDGLRYGDIPEVLAYVHDTKVEDHFKAFFYDTFALYNHIEKEVTKIIDKEKALIYEPTGKQLAAGIENLNKFGLFGTIDSLADGDVLKHKAVINLPYHYIFTKLLYEKTKAEYTEAAMKLSNNRF